MVQRCMQTDGHPCCPPATPVAGKLSLISALWSPRRVAVVPFPSSSGSSLGPLPSHSHGVLPPSPLLPPGPGLGLAPKSPHLSTTMRHDFMTLLRQVGPVARPASNWVAERGYNKDREQH